MGIVDDIKTLTNPQKQPDQDQRVSSPLKKILIVEDEKALATALEERFKDEGFLVEIAENGKIGLDKTLSFVPDVIILDLLMPVMGGQTMLLKLRENSKFKFLPVVVLTNNGDVENIRDTQLFGNAIEFLIKSNVTLEDIVSRVKRLV